MLTTSGGAKTAKELVRDLAIEALETEPAGLRWSELKERIGRRVPDMKSNTIHGSLWAFMLSLPPEVVKPSRGHYLHAKFVATSAKDPQKAAAPTLKTPECDFYQPFADWLVSELEECTKAIPLGGNTFKDKWGTPDIIGVREPRKSDIVKFPTEIVAAEVKTDGYQLITAFGQACAYRLFSHKSYLVVPETSPEDDLARLDVLSRTVGIGLILFDASCIQTPRFQIRVRAPKHEPDMFYVNRCLKIVEEELFE